MRLYKFVEQFPKCALVFNNSILKLKNLNLILLVRFSNFLDKFETMLKFYAWYIIIYYIKYIILAEQIYKILQLPQACELQFDFIKYIVSLVYIAISTVKFYSLQFSRSTTRLADGKNCIYKHSRIDAQRPVWISMAALLADTTQLAWK